MNPIHCSFSPIIKKNITQNIYESTFSLFGEKMLKLIVIQQENKKWKGRIRSLYGKKEILFEEINNFDVDDPESAMSLLKFQIL